jgi:tetratricopeptide (TPR) repeat protein
MANLSAHLAEHDQALATYQRALEIEPTNIRALNGIAQIHRLQGDFDRAIEILNLSADLNPTAIDPLVELAPLYQALGEPELALNALQTALARSSDTGVSIRLAIADLHRRQGRDEAALSELEALSDEEPDSISALVALAREYLRRGEAIRADELVQHALTISSPSAADLRSLSRLLEALGEFEQALDLVQMAAAMDPMNPTSLLQLGGLSNELSDYPAALAAYKHATEIGTSDGRTWLSYGDFLLQTGEREAALESYGNGMSFDPTFIPNYSATVGLLSPETDIERMDEILAAAKEAVPANALVGLVEAQFLRDQQEWAAAEDLLRGAIANAPGALELYLALGNLQMQLGRYAEAIESFSHATRIDKTSVEASIGIAEALRLSGDRSEAISTLEEAWTSNPPSPESQILLAELYREEFRPELAEVALRNALERFPTNTSVELELIDFYHRNGLHRVALDHASSLAEDWPDSMDLQIAYGNSLRQAGQTAEAEVIFGRAESLSSVTSAGLRALAAVREAEDNYEEARALLDRAISLDPEDPLNWVALADLLIQLEFYPDAKQALDRSIEIEPDDPRMWIALGDYYLSVDFPVSAIDAFKRALEIAPSSTQAYRGLVDAYVQRFEIYPETTDYARLNEIFAKMEQIAPGSYQIDIIQSSALQSQRRWFEAIDALQSAIAKAPGVPDPYLALGTALGRTAQYEAMRDVYLRALVVEPTNSRAFDGIDTYYRTAETPDEDMPLIHTAAYMTALLERDVHVGPQAEELSRDLSPSGSQINAYLRSLPVDPGRD